MKKVIVIIMLVACAMSMMAESNRIAMPPQYQDARFVLYPTENMWNFIKLDTQTGRTWLVQYSVEEDKRGEIILSADNQLLPNMEAKVGRFALYPTQNFYNFIMVDQFNGRTWQVQMSLDSKENRWARPISRMTVVEKKSDVDTYSSSYNHEYRDLGLPSGTLWATCNLGAVSPEDNGDFFAWGETEPKDFFTQDNYKFIRWGKYTKYVNDSSYGCYGHVDTLKVLQKEDDAAAALWGGNWRVPTVEQWEELADTNYCTTSYIKVNGRKGLQITSKINKQSIFIPQSQESTSFGIWDIPYYWSSTLGSFPQYGRHVLVLSDVGVMYGENRSTGLPIRPVRKK